MSVAQPKHLIVPGFTTGMSGANVVNYGTQGTSFGFVAGSSPTHYEHVPNGTPLAGYLDLKTADGANLPGMSNGGTTPGNSMVTNVGLMFRIGSFNAGRADIVTHAASRV